MKGVTLKIEEDRVLAVAALMNQPVTFMLESSDDLQNWSAMAERVLFRAGPDAAFVIVR